ncbi:MAG: glycosyl transferase [Nitrospinae bacterium RIFCSPLOWO2_12_39_16]|nr:MAG: glycosyl transferase [Nitrospinae bacterium RIFCSPLOWO2_12_39_16]
MKKLISIITSAYNEEGCIDELSRQLQAVFYENKMYDFEAIIIENGSMDGTYEKLIKIREKDPRFKIVQLSRNFRMDGGITAGLQYAKGDAAVIMTANLQDKPSIINDFIKKWEEGYDHVYGIVKSRPGKGIFRRLNSLLFYILINKMTDNMIPKNASDFRLIDKKVYETINSMEERNRFTRGMFAWLGFKSIGIEFERAKRFAGESHASFWKVLELAVKGIFAFSYIPIRLISFFGLTLSFISLTYLVYTVFKIIFTGVPFAGYGTIVSLMLLLFGFSFLMLGILGQYIAQIYEEVKARPNFIVRKEIGFND